MKRKLLALTAVMLMAVSSVPAYAAQAHEVKVVTNAEAVPAKPAMLSTEALKAKAVELGIIDESMDITKSLTVEEACVIAWKALGMPDAKNGFIAPCAVNAETENKTAIKWAVGKGIISGSEDIKLHANGIKLAEIALRADFDVDRVSSPTAETLLRYIIELGQRELDSVGNGLDGNIGSGMKEPEPQN